MDLRAVAQAWAIEELIELEAAQNQRDWVGVVDALLDLSGVVLAYQDRDIPVFQRRLDAAGPRIVVVRKGPFDVEPRHWLTADKDVSGNRRRKDRKEGIRRIRVVDSTMQGPLTAATHSWARVREWLSSSWQKSAFTEAVAQMMSYMPEDVIKRGLNEFHAAQKRRGRLSRAWDQELELIVDAALAKKVSHE